MEPHAGLWYGRTLLHRACSGPNVADVVALLQSERVDMNAGDAWGWRPVHYAVSNRHPRVVAVLCAAGADLRARDQNGYSAIDRALARVETAHVLVANGVRLITVHDHYRHHITPAMEAFERGVLRCRAAVAALLSIKRAGNLWRWDKFLLREIAYAMWATRHFS